MCFAASAERMLLTDADISSAGRATGVVAANAAITAASGSRRRRKSEAEPTTQEASLRQPAVASRIVVENNPRTTGFLAGSVG